MIKFSKTILLIIVLFFVVVTLYIFQLFIKPSQTVSTKTIPSLKTFKGQPIPAKLTGTNLDQGIINISAPLIFKFDKTIDLNLLEIEIKPETRLSLSQPESGKIIVTPSNNWDFDTGYTVIVRNKNNSNIIEKPYQYKFNTNKYEGI